MEISNKIKYLGVNDHDIDLFEGQYKVPNGISYNSYIILDEKVAVLDTVDARFYNEWLGNIKAVLGDKAPDYLIVHHMEPDHSANIANFLNEYPDTVVVSSAKAFDMMKNFFGTDYADRRIVVTEGATLELGEHTLSFVTAPMVHWPEVIMSYESNEKILFSADGFGKFGALDCEEAWDDEARRYYIGIVGKYGAQVMAVLKKAASLDIETICPLHGPVLKEDLGHYIGLYSKWASYEAEEDGVIIAYASVYGNTAKAAKLLAKEIEALGKKAIVYDLARCDTHAAIADAFRYSKLVLASMTYNATVFPCMRAYIEALTDRGYKNRTVGFIENGSWAPMAAKVMKGLLESAKDLTYTENNVKFVSAVKESDLTQIKAIAEELCR